MLDALGLETCQFVNAKERGCPQGGKAGSKWREDVILQTTVGGSGAYGRLVANWARGGRWPSTGDHCHRELGGKVLRSGDLSTQVGPDN